MVIIDGANVAYSRQHKGKPMVENIELARQYFEPKTVVDIFVKESLKRFINNRSKFNKLVDQGIIILIPKTQDDDKVILKTAYEYDDYILSNDKFRNHKEYTAEWIKNHRIGYLVRRNIIYTDREIKSYNLNRMTRMFSKKHRKNEMMEELN